MTNSTNPIPPDNDIGCLIMVWLGIFGCGALLTLYFANLDCTWIANTTPRLPQLPENSQLVSEGDRLYRGQYRLSFEYSSPYATQQELMTFFDSTLESTYREVCRIFDNGDIECRASNPDFGSFHITIEPIDVEQNTTAFTVTRVWQSCYAGDW